MKKTILFLIVTTILLLTGLVSIASALSVENEDLGNVIVKEFPKSPAHFRLTVQDPMGGSYNIYTLSDVKILPASGTLNIGTTIVDVFVYPQDISIDGHYTFTYTLKKSDGEEIDSKLTVKIVKFQDLIIINSDSNDPDLDTLTFYVQNKENKKIQNITGKFNSPFFETEKTFSLEPFEKTELTVDVDHEKVKKFAAGSYIIRGEFETGDRIEKVDGKIYLGEKKGVETEEDSSGFLIRTNSITKINIGNVEEVVNVELKKDILTRLFLTLNNEPDTMERNGLFVTYRWTKKLGPAEIFSVKARSNYLYPLLIIIFLTLVIYGFRRYGQTKIEVQKSVAHVRTKGGEFALRVRLNIKARKSMENVSLIDKIPIMVKVYEKFGLVKPTKIDAKNRRIHWDIGNLNAGEERVFNYIIYSKIGVVGKFSLPEATVVFEKDGEIHEVESNKVFFLSEQVSSND